MNEEPLDESLLLETTLNQLISQTDSGFDTDRRLSATDTTSVVNIDLVPQRGKLTAKADVRGSQNKMYQVLIQFQTVKYNPPANTDRVTFVAAEQTYAISPIDIGNSNVKVRCQCLDFRFRFAMINSADGSLFGNRPPIYRPVPNSVRGAANPSKTPGICKHIKCLMDELESGGLFNTEQPKQEAQPAQQQDPTQQQPENPAENNSEKI